MRRIGKKSVAALTILFIFSIVSVLASEFPALLATGFGLGHSPVLPGTAGALGGIALALAISLSRVRHQVWACAALVLLAIPVCEHGSPDRAEKDDPRIVADELLTFPVATLGLPIRRQPMLLGAVFITSRIFDWTKPPPSRAAERLPGGTGTVSDDLVANAWTLLVWSFVIRFRRKRANAAEARPGDA